MAGFALERSFFRGMLTPPLCRCFDLGQITQQRYSGLLRLTRVEGFAFSPQTFKRQLMQVHGQSILIIWIDCLQFNWLIGIAGMAGPSMTQVTGVVMDEEFAHFGLAVGQVGHCWPRPEQRVVPQPSLLRRGFERA
ncbi:hypothetical protein D3C81_1603960 [compost metagenome]